MSIYYYLFDMVGKKCLNLGSKASDAERGFEGPIIWIDSKRFLLPTDLLKLLIDRFYQLHGQSNVFLLSEDELFDSGKYLSENEICISIGTDEDNAPPLDTYIPELRDSCIREMIAKDAKLKL